MPWFKIDDSAHSHPKWVKAGNAALGLWARCGSYSAQHLTEGVVPGDVARMYGTAPQARKLVKVGLWHEAGHDCDRCPQPDAGDYVMHDFFESGRNTTKAQAEAARDAAAERQRRRRAKQDTEKNASDSPSKTDRFVDEKSANRGRKDPPFSQSAAGQEGLSQRDATDGVTPPHADSHASTPYGSTTDGRPRAGDAHPDPIPDWALPLVHLMQANGLDAIRWNLNSADWVTVHALMKAKGEQPMAACAIQSARNARTGVSSAKYFIPGWKQLPNKAPDDPGGIPQLRVLSGEARRGGAYDDHHILTPEQARDIAANGGINI
ncbi:hypothetical protein CDO52_12830 [Nocardiopsis gilva YIM 90087]|uniref:Mucin-2 n=1 Tax=Nocardiopsis gilva YIM 90087 TaxID=1235441 RepID=A0A223S616_9ACTN|nr:hypothetical protein [Nocardiopsis gilva]ASU83554.1 hypothetical protein CDO52_12830 [Nocardiopsis gilva YIM 90087]